MAKAMFGAGCFWGVEVTFRQVPGVTNVTVGYSGGVIDNPTYEAVCSGTTNHAEVVLVEFDPAAVRYETLLEVFWSMHDPTTLNRQGPDVGTQYRSAAYFYDEKQREGAEASKRAVDESGRHANPVVTEISPAAPFYAAEDYHQRYLEKRGLASCHIPPKTSTH